MKVPYNLDCSKTSLFQSSFSALAFPITIKHFLVLVFKKSILILLLRSGPPCFRNCLVLHSDTIIVSNVLLTSSSKDVISPPVNLVLSVESRSSLSARVFLRSKLYDR